MDGLWKCVNFASSWKLLSKSLVPWSKLAPKNASTQIPSEMSTARIISNVLPLNSREITCYHGSVPATRRSRGQQYASLTACVESAAKVHAENLLSFKHPRLLRDQGADDSDSFSSRELVLMKITRTCWQLHLRVASHLPIDGY